MAVGKMANRVSRILRQTCLSFEFLGRPIQGRKCAPISMELFPTFTLSTLAIWLQLKVQPQPLLGACLIFVVGSYTRRLQLSIDHALALSYRRNMYDGKTLFVAHITLVKGIPFYGYHVGYRFFLKIYLHNPLHMTRLGDLFRQGAVMKKAIQPFESHLQYILQWMCDYNLYGCAYIDCNKYSFRGPVPDSLEMQSAGHHWHDTSIHKSLITDDNMFPRQSHCSIEIDVCVQDIMNRLDTKERRIHHDFIERKRPLPADEKLVYSMAGLWRDETRRRKARMLDSDLGDSPFPREALISISADPRNSQRGVWIHETEYLESMQDFLQKEEALSDQRSVSFENFVQPEYLSSAVQTAFQSIEELFPHNLCKVVNSRISEDNVATVLKNSDCEEVDVDESRILSLEQDDFAYESDEELAQDLKLTERYQRMDIETDQVDSKVISKLQDLTPSISPTNTEKLSDLVIQMKNSAADLAAVGITTVDCQIDSRSDAFTILSEYASNNDSSVVTRCGQEEEMPEAIEWSRNWLKKSSITALSGYTKSSEDESTHEAPFVVETADPHVKDHFDTAHPVCVAQDSDNSGPLRKLPGNRKRLSREPHSPRVWKDFPVNTKFSVPVVNNPHHPCTIQSLSQTRNPTQTPGRPQSKHVSFDTSVMSNLDGPRLRKKPPETNSSSVVHSPRSSAVSSEVHNAFGIPRFISTLVFSYLPPSFSEISKMMRTTNIPSVIYQDAYYSDERDVPERSREYAGKEFKLESKTVPYLPDFDPTGLGPASVGENLGVVAVKVTERDRHSRLRRMCNIRLWEIGVPPPRAQEVRKWLRSGNIIQDLRSIGYKTDLQEPISQIDGPSQKDKHGFKYSQKQACTSVRHETQYMSLMSLEIHVNTRAHMVPNPEQDEISCLFWCIQSTAENLVHNSTHGNGHVGIIALSESTGLAHRISQLTSVEVGEESSELDLMNRLVDIVRQYDPDVLTGFEVHGSSWGYMIERARHKYDYNLCDELSRMKSQSHGRFGRENDKWGFNQTSTIRITGRHMINIWRAMRSELNLLQYTMENIVFHLLHRRIPHYAHIDLTKWYNSPTSRDLAKVIGYFVSRVQLDLEILEENELIPRISEQARLLGVDFFSVISRGSQFKVESLMFRIAKPENFILISPSRKQVGQQNALECLPLVMEPQSAFYNSPLLVLDFQSLYPSVMIAYNYCYSTFMGRIVDWRGQNKMGFTDFKRDARLIKLLKDKITIAPNGMMYVRPEIRKSLLAKMLGEILETRVMVKSGMKADKSDKTLQRLLNNRQLALKLIANVTYGYTSASFSGRMPCSEIADSIVQTGRETLEKAIALIHSVERWGAEVVYGDTDSLFVYLKGRTKDEAFDIGNEIATTITDMNPRPVKLKFEKVYMPSILLAKKRYVGFKYESKTQTEPEFDAKGIETVRRDGTPAAQKIEEMALKILFRTADLSRVKKYFQKQCARIMKSKVSIQDFCFAKEVKLGTYSDKGPPPPGALISTRKMLQDPRAEPQYGERVPYVVITGAPGARLIDRCVAPDVLLHNAHIELDAEYYISKNIIPPLERIFNLVGANVRHWYDEMPKFQRIRQIESPMLIATDDLILSKKTLESYMKSSACFVCHRKLDEEGTICDECMQRPATSILELISSLRKTESKAVNLKRVCRSCAGLAWGEDIKCDSQDCPVFYTRTRNKAGLRVAKLVTEPIVKILGGAEETELQR